MADKIKIAVAVALLIAVSRLLLLVGESDDRTRRGGDRGAVARAAVFLTTAQGKEFFAFRRSPSKRPKRVVWRRKRPAADHPASYSRSWW